MFYPAFSLVTGKDCEELMTVRGKGGVCEIDETIVGFGVADLKENNKWALFIDTVYEGQGIGMKLHQMMMDWYFSQTKTTIWLGTAPGKGQRNFMN